ncbi:hypothetical protein [Streptomyces sp. NRRL S-813]|uniref:hypothetical protein n=1 Tax=Streptomyces sp. NRRL S-813 TaxID=1463919 RepID=UPI000AC3300B|nr:hypothetical protein [Streptomyces sp. NRRL S-813]
MKSLDRALEIAEEICAARVAADAVNVVHHTDHTAPLPPAAPTRTLSDGGAGAGNAEPSNGPTPGRRWTDRRGALLLTALSAYELTETADDSKNANCGWRADGTIPFQLVLDTQLLGNEADAHVVQRVREPGGRNGPAGVLQEQGDPDRPNPRRVPHGRAGEP